MTEIMPVPEKLILLSYQQGAYGQFLYRQIGENVSFWSIFHRQLFSGDEAGDEVAVSLLNKT